MINSASLERDQQLLKLYQSNVQTLEALLLTVSQNSNATIRSGIWRTLMVNLQQVGWCSIKTKLPPYGAYDFFDATLVRFVAQLNRNAPYYVDGCRIAGDTLKCLGSMYASQGQNVKAISVCETAQKWYRELAEDDPNRIAASFTMSVRMLMLSLAQPNPSQKDVETLLAQAGTLSRKFPANNSIQQDYLLELRVAQLWYRLLFLPNDKTVIEDEIDRLMGLPLSNGLRKTVQNLKRLHYRNQGRIHQRLTLMLDVSASMDGDKMTALKAGVVQLLQSLHLPFTLTLYSFAGDIQVAIPTRPIATALDLVTVREVINRLFCRNGGTALYAAFLQCLNVAEQVPSAPPVYDGLMVDRKQPLDAKEQVQEDYMFLLTDGYEASVCEPAEMTKQIQKHRYFRHMEHNSSLQWKLYTVRKQNEVADGQIQIDSAALLPQWFQQLRGSTKAIIAEDAKGVLTAFEDMQDVMHHCSVLDVASL
jgi:hypothetical protein